MTNLSMYKPPHQGRTADAIAEPRRERSDEASYAIVNQGISVQSSCNTVCAVEYMKSHNVDADIIERVLLHPEQRRR